ncbi:ARM repeat-containing protein [Aureobasidium pullulans]|uniref:ARM repeat-containing protein n=1 Tax=Aureobasidium pullulans TaxID=5580 RepID=A0A4S9BYI8_AURPU|nr:ARM repeat-containing protein [Aureobasidium pullulans]
MDVSVSKALADKMYDRRKGGALELEAIIRDSLAANDHVRIEKIVHQLCHDYAYAVHQPHARNGGLIGLAAAAIALGVDVARYLRDIVPPVLACFSDQDARVRYYACESMYNIAKVAKGEILIYFNDVFDALCKLAADTELSVKNGAELLDRLVKDIVAESAASYVSILDNEVDPNNEDPFAEQATAFSLARFIPLLRERIFVINPFTRTFLVSWITLLDSIPDLELVVFLPDFLGGLLRFLSDPNNDVHTTTRVCLDRFLTEIKKISAIKKGIAESKRSLVAESQRKASISSRDGQDTGEQDAETQADNANTNHDDDKASSDSASFVSSNLDEKNDNDAGDEWIPGQDVQIDHAKILDILIQFLNDSAEEEIQMTTLRWIEGFFDICAEDMLAFVPRLLSQVLPALSHHVDTVRQAANRVNTALMAHIMSLPEDGQQQHPKTPVDPSRRDSVPIRTRKANSPELIAESATTDQHATSIPLTPQPSPPVSTELDYEAAVNSLTLQFLNEHEQTRVAALAWLIMLHRKSPRKTLAIQDGTFPALLKTLSDPADAVVTRDLTLLSQISKNSDDSYFTSFMVNLLKLFCTDRKLLENRGNLIIRQLCLNLSAERIYRTLADCLEKDDDVEFASIMVQNLNNNLITAPELADLRKRLRNLENRDGQTFFVTLFRAWCHNAVATFSLCLLAQAYEQAYNLLQIIAELEMTVNMLIQIDKLVQLLESPVFTYLRLQLLEPERFPHLYKCLYGLLMLLPQSSAFAALKNRLNSVSAIGYLHIAPRTAPSTPSVSTFDRPNRLKSREDPGIKWSDLLEKFKSVQEKARRAQQRPQRLTTLPNGLTLPDMDDDLESPTLNKEASAPAKEKATGRLSGLGRPGSAASITRPAATPTQTQGHSKSKSSLSQLGRFTRSTAAKATGGTFKK